MGTLEASHHVSNRTDLLLVEMMRQRMDKRERTWVYRLFDWDGALLYVGVTKNREHRLRQHRRSSPWWPAACRIQLDYYATRLDATCAETTAIQQEAPLHNVAKSSRTWGFDYAREPLATIWMAV